MAKTIDTGCFQRARRRKQQTFTLVAQDRTAAKVVCLWIAENIDTAPADKLRTALEEALIMRDHTPRKHAD